MIGRDNEPVSPERNVEIGDVVFKAEHVTVPHPYIANTNQVEDVSFEVREGEVFGFCGSGGCRTVGEVRNLRRYQNVVRRTDAERRKN